MVLQPHQEDSIGIACLVQKHKDAKRDHDSLGIPALSPPEDTQQSSESAMATDITFLSHGATATTNLKRSFFALPPELRHMVYEYAFSSGTLKLHSILDNWIWKSKISPGQPNGVLGWALSCKKAYYDVPSSMFKSNTRGVAAYYCRNDIELKGYPVSLEETLSQRVHLVTFIQFSWTLKHHSLKHIHPEHRQQLLKCLLEEHVMIFPNLEKALLAVDEHSWKEKKNKPSWQTKHVPMDNLWHTILVPMERLMSHYGDQLQQCEITIGLDYCDSARLNGDGFKTRGPIVEKRIADILFYTRYVWRLIAHEQSEVGYWLGTAKSSDKVIEKKVERLYKEDIKPSPFHAFVRVPRAIYTRTGSGSEYIDHTTLKWKDQSSENGAMEDSSSTKTSGRGSC